MDGLSKSNICFVANYTGTFVFHAVAEELQEHGYAVFWIVVNRKLREYLLEHYNPDYVLYIGKKYVDNPSGKTGEFKLNELVYGDRALKHIPDQGIKYLLHIQQPVYDFIKTNGIRYIFGELTWAHELLIKRITEQRPELGCCFLNPASIRIPNGRFAFFTDEFQSELLAVHGPTDAQALHSERIKVEKPEYLASNDRALQRSRSVTERLKKIKRFITAENIDDNDPTLINRRWVRFWVRCKEELNSELYRLVKRLSLAEVGDRKFVFVALHKQPEASIDVIGRYYDDQYANIVNLWRITPDDWLVLIKEHTNAIGDRSLRFYFKLGRLPNVYFIREDEDSHEIIRRSELVATVSGTVAYEATLLGKAAVTLAPTFFSRAPNCRRIGLDDLRKAQHIYEIIGDEAAAAPDLESFVLGNSFPGIISDPISNDWSMHPENIRKIAAAIMHVVEQ